MVVLLTWPQGCANLHTLCLYTVETLPKVFQIHKGAQRCAPFIFFDLASRLRTPKLRMAQVAFKFHTGGHLHRYQFSREQFLPGTCFSNRFTELEYVILFPAF
jgi:hypothetical protein